MAQVTLRVNGYAYVLGCADGEEEHLLALASDIDHRIDDIKTAAGPSGEARLLLMAALMISDELHDLRQAQEASSPSTGKVEPKIGRRLRGIAKRAEAIADTAEAPALTAVEETSAPAEEHVAATQDQS
jgi:cell division protein ZapA